MTNSDNSMSSTPGSPPGGRKTPRARVAPRKRATEPLPAEPLEELLRILNIQVWDVLILGDGSGRGWEDACGWAGCLIDRRTRGRKLLSGGMNHGSINLAELMPYLHALCWYHQAIGKDLLAAGATLVVQVVTDSDQTATNGARSCDLSQSLPEGPWRPLWAALRDFVRMGYQIRWRWTRRDGSDLSRLSDAVAALCRRQMLNLCEERGRGPDPAGPPLADQLAAALAGIQLVDPASGETLSPYHCNPFQSELPPDDGATALPAAS